MKTQYTPGPWRLMNSHKPGYLNVYTTHECNSEHETEAADFICEIGPGSRTPHSEQYGNARLIAAAPELLEALQTMIGAFNVKEIDPLVAFASIEKAKAAIKKAQGD